MPLPVIQKTWKFDVNQAYTVGATSLDTHRKVLRGIKDSLVTTLGGQVVNAWTVKRSSAGDDNDPQNADLWTTDSALVWATSTPQTPANHSWIVLEQVGIGSNFQICIDLDNSSDYFLTVVMAPSGFPTSGADAGTKTTRPKGTPEVVLLDQAWSQTWLGNANTLQIVVHAMQSTDGQCTRVVAYWQNQPILFWLFDKANRAVANWALPAVALTTGTQNGNLHYNVLHSVASPNLRGYSGAPLSFWMSTESFGNGVEAIGAKLLQPNALDLNWPLTPIGLASLDPGQAGRHGELYDIWFGSAGANGGDTYPGDGSHQFAQFGHLVFPWDGQPGNPGTPPQTA